MRENLDAIKTRLQELQVPPDLIASHVRRVELWRLSHPPKLKRHRSYEFVLTANGHRVRFDDKGRAGPCHKPRRPE